MAGADPGSRLTLLRRRREEGLVMKDVFDLLAFKETDKFCRGWYNVVIPVAVYSIVGTELRCWPSWGWIAPVVLN